MLKLHLTSITLKKFYHKIQGNIWLSIDEYKDPSDTDVGEQEVTRSSEPSEKKTTPQQLRWSERIQKPNKKYVNTAIIKDEVKEPERYEKVSQTAT